MLFINALLIDASGRKTGALRTEGERIAAVGDLKPIEGEEIIDAKGRWLMPGLVDLKFHLRDPGHKRIETIGESTRLALEGGITTLLAAPDTIPPIDNETVAEYILGKAAAANGARVAIAGEIAKEGKLNDLAKLFAAGLAAIEGCSELSGNAIRRAFEYALMADKPAFFFCQNRSLAGSGVMRDGETAARLGLPAIPDYAESCEAARIAEIASAIGAKLVVETASAARTIRALEPYLGDRIAAQVLLTHLLLCDEDCNGFNNACKLNPPLGLSSDRDALIAGVKSGKIAAIASGHLPQDESSRDRPFELASGGADMAGIFLSLAHTELIATGKLTIEEFVRAASLNPARILGLNAGALEAGKNADLILFDPTIERVAPLREGVAKTAWSGKTLRGKVAIAIVGGRTVFSAD